MKIKTFAKKAAALIMICCMLFVMCACGQSTGQSDVTVSAETGTESSADSSTEASPEATGTTAGTDAEKQETDDANPEAQGGQITFTDMMDRQVTLNKPAERIVVLTAAECEILYALGAGDSVIGRGEYCDYPEEVLDVQAVQSGLETNIEQIISLNPDIVIMNTMNQTLELLNSLENAGIKVAETTAADIEGVYESISMIGTITGKNEEAKELISSMKDTFASIESESEATEGKTVYFEVSPLEYGLWTAGNGTFMNEISEIIGLENCFFDIEGWAEISQEQVISKNPDVIVTLTKAADAEQTPEEEIKSRSGWEGISAVKNDMIINFPNEELTRPGPRLAEGARMLADFVRQ